MSDPVLQSLVVALVLTKLDYGSATLAELPAVQLDRLQSLLNAVLWILLSRLSMLPTFEPLSGNSLNVLHAPHRFDR